MIIKYVVKDLVSSKYINGYHYWSLSFVDNIEEAHVWDHSNPAKAFITSHKRYLKDNQDDTDLMVVKVEVRLFEAP
jgi:hypothetical protein